MIDIVFSEDELNELIFNDSCVVPMSRGINPPHSRRY